MATDAVTLLDVNVLVALFDPDHVHHETAHDWFADHRVRGWATCPMTENGLVRVLSHPSYHPSAPQPRDVAARLQAFCDSGHHHYWPDTVTLRDVALFDPDVLWGHRQVTDMYLLGLAVKMNGRLATFDRSIHAGSVLGGGGRLDIIAPADEVVS